MRTQLKSTLLAIGCAAFFAGPARCQQLVISPRFEPIIAAELDQAGPVFEIDPQAAERIGQAFEQWVSQRLDLGSAELRVSRRHPDRVIYTLDLPPEVDEQPPISVIYRTSPGWYGYRKLFDEPAENEMDTEQLTTMARDFLLQNEFVELSNSDGFDDVLVRQLRRDSQLEPGNPQGVEQLLLQSVRFARQFMDAPVVNSSITLDYQPDSGEILAFKHYNWTPAAGAMAAGGGKAIDEVYRALQEQAEQYGSPDDQLQLTHVTRGWFQSPNELIPILICQVSVPHDDHLDGYTQLINLVGDDDVFAPGRQPPQTPDEDCYPACREDYAQWVAAGKPACWCYHRQCHGDADGQLAGSSKTGFHAVGPADLNLLIAGWLVKEPPQGAGIGSVPDAVCADFAHDLAGSTKTGFYRVGPSDLNILMANWLKKEPPQGPGVPDDCLQCQ